MIFKNMISYASQLSKKRKILVYAAIIVVCAVIIVLGLIRIKELNTVYKLPLVVGVSHFCTYDEFMEYLPPSSLMKNLTPPETGEYIMSVGCGEKGNEEEAAKYIFNEKDIISYTVIWVDASGFDGSYSSDIGDKLEYCMVNKKQIAEIFFTPNADKEEIIEDMESTKEIEGISVRYGNLWFAWQAEFTVGADRYVVNSYSDDETELIKIVSNLIGAEM